jgi:hypothetical protein
VLVLYLYTGRVVYSILILSHTILIDEIGLLYLYSLSVPCLHRVQSLRLGLDECPSDLLAHVISRSINYNLQMIHRSEFLSLL